MSPFHIDFIFLIFYSMVEQYFFGMIFLCNDISLQRHFFGAISLTRLLKWSHVKPTRYFIIFHWTDKWLAIYFILRTSARHSCHVTRQYAPLLFFVWNGLEWSRTGPRNYHAMYMMSSVTSWREAGFRAAVEKVLWHGGGGIKERTLDRGGFHSLSFFSTRAFWEAAIVLTILNILSWPVNFFHPLVTCD